VNESSRFKILVPTVIAVFLIAGKLHAGSAEGLAPTVNAIVHKLEDHYHRASTLKAVFLERYLEGSRQTRVESGTVYFKRPGRMRWEYESPDKKLFLVDGKTVWFYVPSDHTVTKAPVKESSDWRTPLSLLTGKADLPRLCRRIDLVNQGSAAPGHAIVRCLPKGEKIDKSSPESKDSQDSTELPGAGDFTDVLLEVDTSTGQLVRIEIRQPGGIELEYRFGNWEEGIALPDDTFQFKVPPGVAIVDGSALARQSR
jgi:outer membrane lipoprotein carrier protein